MAKRREGAEPSRRTAQHGSGCLRRVVATVRGMDAAVGGSRDGFTPFAATLLRHPDSWRYEDDVR